MFYFSRSFPVKDWSSRVFTGDFGCNTKRHKGCLLEGKNKGIKKKWFQGNRFEQIFLDLIQLQQQQKIPLFLFNCNLRPLLRLSTRDFLCSLLFLNLCLYWLITPLALTSTSIKLQSIFFIFFFFFFNLFLLEGVKKSADTMMEDEGFTNRITTKLKE